MGGHCGGVLGWVRLDHFNNWDGKIDNKIGHFNASVIAAVEVQLIFMFL